MSDSIDNTAIPVTPELHRITPQKKLKESREDDRHRFDRLLEEQEKRKQARGEAGGDDTEKSDAASQDRKEEKRHWDPDNIKGPGFLIDMTA